MNTGAERFMSGTGTTSASITIPAGSGQMSLIVVDWICASGLGGTTAEIDITGVSVAQRAGAVSGTDFFLDFSGGYPVWSASGNDTAVDATVAVTLAGVTSAAKIAVGFHYENPAKRRAFGQEG